jgi:hypothetical protein
MSDAENKAQSGIPVFHRLRSPTQTTKDDQIQVGTMKICGKSAWGSHIPTVKAYPGHLPPADSGIEFSTPVAPTPGSSTPSMVKWYQGTPGVISGGPGLVCIPVSILKVVP